ncbi:bifunctional UDP-N-acetylglucosamine diphosphorylase/glucosamine-1-phosphate N-acetyltransferase GlmU [Helicobacter sp. MIT 14-3879]|uniref:bifunctional UDP-N-acetylglucosamine diphosphorylase/glucosamine-1-phosphate N-acetyltransferase GlmU n=1 Tax=Helicobacter sp. MIT 14-3879 TaxID=2040649 RepID=UPI000E1F7865|nr:bifunctional UDP-N-acetylglucosamine diphosphorylase/glucosamine-1-phosphate N-acetyltransferase GlmU [Helicobacter sp. MIT 14-3879]RDU61722.1 bifunctional UDP-N-acetylglucosamine diphosphorylase/glucosamine-1-phosphate N-acetyltransferase GlmU [Helicobacter sp. MIT 14-3879]
MVNKTSVIILAGGFGTRMKSSTPKVMHKICGKEMLFCIIDEVQNISDDIHIVLFNEADLIKDSINKVYQNNTFNFHLQDYKNYPGTAGALMQGGDSDSAKNPFEFKYDKTLILSGDMPLVRAEKLEEFTKLDCDIVLGILELDDASGYGRVVIKNDKVIKIIEEKDASDEIKKINFANAGIYCIKKNILRNFLKEIDNKNNQNEFYLTDIILYSDDLRAVIAKEDDFMGVNSKLDLSKAESIMLKRLRDKAMKNGVTIRIPDSVYIEFGVEFEGECEVESGVVLKGKSKIISSKILSNSVIESSLIKDSTIGPFGRIRPKSNIINSHIGNFVEVKASNLNEVKAGHLSYLGDSKIGSGTNIGAGVITCNYDGKEKHKTNIENNVFVGSGTQLIAPINIESNVLIAAGSTVTKNAKNGDLVIARAKQENRSNFFYKFFGKK